MAAPKTHNFEDIVQGNTWNGIYPSLYVTVNGAAPIAELAAVRMQFRKSSTDIAHQTLTSETGGGITINNAATWNITVPPQMLDLCAGEWLYDIEFEDIAGRKKTYVSGTLTVLPAITQSPYENG